MTLAMLISKHRGPLTADFRRYYGLSLAGIRATGIPLLEVADLAGNLPPDSAVARALDPEWFLTADTYLLRAIEHGIRVVAWQRTKDATLRTPQDYPTPTPLTSTEAEAARPEREKYDAMPMQEMAKFLGWPTDDMPGNVDLETAEVNPPWPV